MTAKKKLLILGDSHALAITQGFQLVRPDIETFGNTIRVEAGWDKPFHTGCDPLRFLDDDVQKTFEAFAKTGGYDGQNMLDIDVPMVLSITGLPRLARHPVWARFFHPDAPYPYVLSQQLFEAMLRAYLAPVMDIYRCLSEAGKTVVCVIMPGLRPKVDWRGNLFLKIKDFLIREVQAMGIRVADVTDATCDEHGILDKKYWVDDPQDFSHATAEWGGLVASVCCRELGI